MDLTIVFGIDVEAGTSISGKAEGIFLVRERFAVLFESDTFESSSRERFGFCSRRCSIIWERSSLQNV